MKALLPLLFVFAAAPLAAQPPETVTRAVSSAGLDLTTDAGLRALDQRLTIAIVEACGAASNVDLEGQNDVRACRLEARAKVNAERERLVELASRGTDIILAAR